MNEHRIILTNTNALFMSETSKNSTGRPPLQGSFKEMGMSHDLSLSRTAYGSTVPHSVSGGKGSCGPRASLPASQANIMDTTDDSSKIRRWTGRRERSRRLAVTRAWNCRNHNGDAIVVSNLQKMKAPQIMEHLEREDRIMHDPFPLSFSISRSRIGVFPVFSSMIFCDVLS